MLAELLKFLLENADLIEEIKTALDHGATKDALRAVVRKAKYEATLAALKDEFTQP